MRFFRALLIGFALFLVFVIYFFWANPLVVIYEVNGSPGGSLVVGNDARTISAKWTYGVSLFHLDRDSDISFLCAKDPPPPISRTGYVTPHLQFIVYVKIDDCTITRIRLLRDRTGD